MAFGLASAVAAPCCGVRPPPLPPSDVSLTRAPFPSHHPLIPHGTHLNERTTPEPQLSYTPPDSIFMPLAQLVRPPLANTPFRPQPALSGKGPVLFPDEVLSRGLRRFARRMGLVACCGSCPPFFCVFGETAWSAGDWAQRLLLRLALARGVRPFARLVDCGILGMLRLLCEWCCMVVGYWGILRVAYSGV